jgi:hypothetical protein
VLVFLRLLGLFEGHWVLAWVVFSAAAALWLTVIWERALAPEWEAILLFGCTARLIYAIWETIMATRGYSGLRMDVVFWVPMLFIASAVEVLAVIALVRGWHYIKIEKVE